MSWVRIWIHQVFSTKYRKPFLNSLEIREMLFEHIAQNAKKKNIWLDRIGGYTDHAHCLISLGRNQSMGEVAQLIKGESSHWINKSGLLKNQFVWQDDYWAVSVSESHISSVRKYIQNQEAHHGMKSFSEEIDLFMKKYGWEFVKNRKR